MPGAVQIIALLLLIFGLMLLLAAYRLGQAVRPTGHVEYVDGEVEATVPRGPLISTADGLAGQPHGLLRITGERQIVPVQVLDGPAPGTLDRATRLSAAVFCLLAEVVYDQAVPYALLRYTDQDIALEWTPDVADEVSQQLAAMRSDAAAADVHRSHDDPAICRACKVRALCDQAIE